MTWAAIVLAAGLSTRMGQCKTTLPWQGQTLLTYQLAQWQAAQVQPIVVLGPHNAHRQADCGGSAVINPDPSRGKASSVLTGLATLSSDVTGIFISAIDQPRPATLYQQLITAHQQHRPDITAPCYAGKLGHPLLFDGRLLPQLLAISDETLGIRAVVQQVKQGDRLYRVSYSEIVLVDLNTPERYERVRSQ
jgi:molybdenum cofactor cytidylyltransferase